MVKKATERTRAKTALVTRRKKKEPEFTDEEEKILEEATKHLVFKHGMFLVATDIRETRIRGLRVWIIAVTLRYDKGDEGYVGDLLYDGEEFSFLTPAEVRKERVRQIANDPERLRKWTVLQFHGTGPWSITYVNSDDDPRKKE